MKLLSQTSILYLILHDLVILIMGKRFIYILFVNCLIGQGLALRRHQVISKVGYCKEGYVNEQCFAKTVPNNLQDHE